MKNFSLKCLVPSFLFLFIFLENVNSQSKQISPLGLNCYATSISPLTLYAASNSGQIYPSISVETNNCTNYTISENCSWLSYTQDGYSVTLYVQTNYGSQRSAYVWIGSYEEPVVVIQECGNAPAAASNISGSSTVCAGQTGVVYSVSPVSGATGYQWLLPNGATIVSGNNTNSITVDFSSNASSGYITVQGSNDCSNGQPSPDFPITISTINQPESIQGSVYVCSGGSYTYSVPQVTGATSYLWNLPSGASGYSNSNSINVVFGATAGTISVRARNSSNCLSNPRSLSTEMATLVQYNVTGGGTICEETSSSVSLQGSYPGKLYSLFRNGFSTGSSLTGTGGSLTWDNLPLAGVYTVTGFAEGNCPIQMNGSATINVLNRSTNPSSINNSLPTICPNGSSVLTVVEGILGSGAEWKWYVNDPNSTPIFTGNQYTVSPSTTTTYYVKAVGTCNNSAPVSTIVNVITPPTFTQHPSNVTICAGSPASFSVVATGANSYQWQTQIDGAWQDVIGATGSVYNISSTYGMNGRSFRCIVSGVCNSTISSSANITFISLPIFTVSGGGAICPGSSTSILLSKSTSGCTYNLYLDENLLTSQSKISTTGEQLTWENISAAGTYTIKAVTLTGCQFNMDQSAVITIKTPSTPPNSIIASHGTICLNDSSLLTINGGSLEYGVATWKWTRGTGSCGSELLPFNQTSIYVKPTESTTYFVHAEGGCVTTPCVSYSVTVLMPPVIENQPSDVTITSSQDATFSINASGSNLQYQWQSSPLHIEDWTNIAGENSSSLIIPNSNVFDSKRYRCHIDSPCHDLNSEAVTIKIPTEYYSGSQIKIPTSGNVNSSIPVGSLPGKIVVDDLGAAIYNIPIDVPPSTAGMQPHLSISYNSLKGNGLLGIGWDLIGLSSIERVPQNSYNDGKVIGVKLDLNDRFALDSNRLICTSGIYGSNASIYSTELETFVQVIAHGSSGNGPSWFEVKTKDGKTLEYGNTIDSKVEAPGISIVYKWRLNRIKDSNNNYIDFIYNEESGESLISKILYTGNLLSNPVLAPYNTIKFSYTERTDVHKIFINGAELNTKKILTKIEIFNEDNLVRKYHFNYVLDFYSHLNEIVEYGKNGARFNSTVIGWGDISEEYGKYHWSWYTGFENVTNRHILGDFNGDTRTDEIIIPDKSTYTSSDQWKLCIGQKKDNTFIDDVATGQLNSNFIGFVISDVDGDGCDEILWHSRELVDNSYLGEVFKVYEFNGIGLIRGNTNYDLTFFNDPGLKLVPADFNGDGKNEYIALDNNNNEITTRGLSEYGTLPSFDNPNSVRIIDFDGDSKKDILVIKGNSSKIYQIDPINSQWITLYSSSFPTSTDRIFVGDFNGDKKTDILSWNNYWHLKLSNGISFNLVEDTPLLRNYDPEASLNDNNYFVADFNGDGNDDVMEVYRNSTQSTFKAFYSIGDGKFISDTSNFQITAINQNYFQTCDIEGDGKKELFHSANDEYSHACLFPKKQMQHFVTAISNGFNILTNIGYERLNNDSLFYKRSKVARLPITDYSGSRYAVYSITNPTADKLYNTLDLFRYEGAKFYRDRKKFLGFEKITTSNSTDSIQYVRSFQFDTIYFFRNLKESVNQSIQIVWADDSSSFYVDNDPRENRREYYLNKKIEFGNKRFLPYVEQISTQDVIENKQITSSFLLDVSGNTTLMTESYSKLSDLSSIDVLKKRYYEYESYGNYGIPNLVRYITDTTTYKSKNPFVKKLEYSYDVFGHLLTETAFPGKTKAVTKTFSSYNDYGLPREVTISAGSLLSRLTKYEYDSKYRFIIKTTNPINNYSTKEYDPANGNLLSETGINNKTINYEYDDFGRLNKTISPTGSYQTVTMAWSGMGYKITKSIPGYSNSYTTYDLFGRELANVSNSPFGEIITEKEYNYDGTLKRMSKPHYANSTLDTIKWINYKYDQNGRIHKITDGAKNNIFQYDLSEVIETIIGQDSTKNFTKLSRKDAFGNLIYVEETTGDIISEISYTYHSSGQPESISSVNGTITYKYNEYGKPDTITNPNSGATSFTYNAYGELVSQVDANNNTTTFAYDKLSRVTDKTTTEGTTSYIYNSSGNGVEHVSTINGPNNTSQSFVYDSFGRITNLTETVESKQLQTSYTYDSFNNLTSITYPSGLVINQLYSNGYLNEIKKGNTTIWKLEDAEADGRPIEFTLGPSNPGIKTYFTYDSAGYLKTKRTGISSNEWQQKYDFDHFNGNLKSRKYKQTGSQSELSESFTYDNYDRLINFGSSRYDSVSYALNGNVSFKTDAGTYEYTGNNNAVTGLTNSPDNTRKFKEEISYTSFNKPFEIKQDNDTIVGNDTILTFTYGPDNQRIKTVFSREGSTIKTKYYSGLYEEAVVNNNIIKYNYISCPYGIIGVDIMQGQTDSLYYIETDHLGSFIGLINSSTGMFSERASFDAWGKRRNPADWTYDSIPQNTHLYRGFTGHEHLDDLGLINMNGRLYDPLVARFLGVDPFVQTVDFSQSYNGYSYCLNNPLKYTDPSGYSMDALPSGSDVWAAYIRATMRGYHDGYGDFSDLFWDRYNDYQFTGGGGGSTGGGFTINWESKYTFTSGARQEVRDDKGTLLYIMLPECGVGYSRGSIIVGGNNYYQIPRGQDKFEATLGSFNDAFSAAGVAATSAEIYTRTIAPSRIDYTNINGASATVSSSKIATIAETTGKYALYAGLAVDITLTITGYQSWQKTVLNTGIGLLPLAIGTGPGLVVGTGYFILDRLGAFDRPTIITPYAPPLYAVPDATRVVLPIYP